jgi:hypothetical protein
VIDTILLDIDGVCARTQYHLLTSFGVPFKDESEYPVECGWDIVAAANLLSGYNRFTPATFFGAITREMWATIPVTTEFPELLELCENLVGLTNVHFLSSPTISPESLAGKLEWIQRNAPFQMCRQFLIGPSKHVCARPSSLLIDDRDENVEEFRQRGGQAVLLPRPWNSLHGYDAMTHLVSCLGG